MPLIAWLLRRTRWVLAVALGLSFLGAFAWFTMPRQEDPTFPERFGVATIVYPGANASDVERLILDPVEEHLAEVSEVSSVEGQARANLAVLTLELGARVVDTEAAWDEVEEALNQARRELPSSAQEPRLRHDLTDAESIVVGLSGSSDRLLLSDAAEDLKKKLLGHPLVKRVELSGVATQEVEVRLSDVALHALGLDGREVLGQLRSRNTNIPGGTLRASGRTITIDPGASFGSLAELEQSPILTGAGEIVSLAQVGSVRLTEKKPQGELARLHGQPAVFLGIVPKPRIDTVAFGRQIRELLAEQDLAPLTVSEMTYQPGRVEDRLSSLGVSLLSGVAIVALVLLLLMGIRVGLVVASLVPVVAFSGLFLYQAGGGILQQISIAALIVALGLLVDSAIVVTESIQRSIDLGMERRTAALSAVRELAVPLLSATATTLIAFLPMLMSQGNVGDFTRALPILLMSTLALSYVFSITVTPTLGVLVLRPSRRGGGASRRSLASRTARLVARLGTQSPGVVTLISLALVVGTLSLASRVPEQFFPMSDRDQLVVELALPEGAEIETTANVARQVETFLDTLPEVTSHASFIGRSVPHFYVNLLSRPQIPHEAQIYIRVRDQFDVPAVASSVRDFVTRELVGVRVTPRPLDVGPPVRAPVEIRLIGDDPEQLEQAALWVAGELETVPEAKDVSHDLGVGAPTVSYAVSDAAALRFGISRADVAESLLRETSGVLAGQYRGGNVPHDIVVRTGRGQDRPPEELDHISVKGQGGHSVPLAQVAQKVIRVEPAAIYHRNGQRTASVVAFLEPGATFSQVLAQLLPRLEQKEFGRIRYEVGGGHEKSAEANAALFEPLPIAGLLLFLVLLAQFNSLRRVVIVLSTIPLAATGVVPGLLVGGQSFGFMSLLGVFSLVGVVVNAAIVLLDQADTRLALGASPQEAMREAVELRTRPILLTVTTTVAGLLPLAMSSSPMWPPMAWAMISGLVASTLLTLVLIPALYVLLVGVQRTSSESASMPGAWAS